METLKLNQEIEAINKDAEIKIQGVKLKAEAIQRTSYEEVIYYPSSNGLGFGWMQPINNKAIVKRIIAAYPIDIDDTTNHELKFASSHKNFVSDSSLVLKWNAESNYDNSIKICYTSNGKEITINVSYAFYGSHVYYRTKQGKHLGFGRYETIRMPEIDCFYTQNYSGGYRVLHFLEGAESLTEYLNWATTGVFQYDNEID